MVGAGGGSCPGEWKRPFFSSEVALHTAGGFGYTCAGASHMYGWVQRLLRGVSTWNPPSPTPWAGRSVLRGGKGNCGTQKFLTYVSRLVS